MNFLVIFFSIWKFWSGHMFRIMVKTWKAKKKKKKIQEAWRLGGGVLAPRRWWYSA